MSKTTERTPVLHFHYFDNRSCFYKLSIGLAAICVTVKLKVVVCHYTNCPICEMCQYLKNKDNSFNFNVHFEIVSTSTGGRWTKT